MQSPLGGFFQHSETQSYLGDHTNDLGYKNQSHDYELKKYHLMFYFTSTQNRPNWSYKLLNGYYLTGLLFVLFYAGCQNVAMAYTITTSTSSVSFCTGATISVSYAISGSGSPSNGNVFTVQLSDAAGSFGSPVTLGSSTSTAGTGSISIVVPSTILSGSGYRIRVNSSSPAVTGSDNGANIAIGMLRPGNNAFSESCGTVNSNTNVGTLESNNGFDNDSYSMTSSSNSNVYMVNGGSSGYTGSSGSGAVFFDGNGSFIISGINSSALTNMQICFAIKKTSNSFSGTGFFVAVSSNGTSWTDLSYSALPTGTGTSTPWYLRYATGSIPATSNLRIRFLRSGASDLYIDDIKLISSGTATSPVITPSTALLTCGGSVTLSSTAINGASYLWSNGSTTSSISVSNIGNYSVTVTDYLGCATTTNAASVTYSSAVVPSVSIASNEGTSICSGTSITFTATPVNGGTSPTYQWQVNGTNVGSNSVTYTTSALSDGQTVSCTMTSNAACASPSIATSNGLSMTVTNAVSPAVSIALTNGSNPLCDASAVTFTATPVNGGSTPSYQWKINGTNAGTNSATFTTAAITNGQVVTCEMTSSITCVSSASATSNGIIMFVSTGEDPTISIAQTTGSNPMCAGSNTAFTATPLNAVSPVYQWKLNGSNVGSNGTVYTTSSLTSDDVVSCQLTSAGSCPTIVTLGTGTETNVGTNDLGSAYPTYYGNGRQQWIIRASELSALGLSAGQITSMGFNVAELTGDPETLMGYTIKIAQTNVTEATNTFLTSGFTTVFGPTNYTPALNTLNAHYFTSPFSWDGTSNLCIDICFSNQVVGTAAYKTYRTASSFVACTYYESDGSIGADACNMASGWTTNYRPNITFTVGGSVEVVASNGITMSVSDGGIPQISIAQTEGTNPICEGANAVFSASVENATSPVYQWKLNGENVGSDQSTYSSNSLNANDVITCELVSAASCPTIGKIGNGTSTNTTTSDNGAAYPTYYGNGRQQWIVLASELEALGLAAGNIYSIGFDVSGTTGDPAILNGYTIKMAHITETEATASFLSPTFTTVFGPQDYTPAVNAQNTHTFSSPFVWDGTSNICIDICFSNQVIGYAAYRTYCTAAPFNACTIYQSDGPVGSGACTETMGWVVTERPNMYFAMDGNSSALISNSITITESPVVVPSVAIALTSGNNPSCEGSSLTFTATPAHGGTAPVYQWKVNGSNVGTNSNTYTTNTLTNGQIITCELTSNEPCASPTTATSSGITVNVNDRPTAVISGSQTVCPGTSVDVSIALTGSGPWSGTLNNGATFSGSSSPVIIPVSVTSSVTYTVATLSDAQCEATADDLSGSAVVNGVDSTPPVAICQDVTVELDDSGQASLTADQVNNGSSDNCGIASMSLNNTSFDCSHLGASVSPSGTISSTDGYDVNVSVSAVSVVPSSLSCEWGYNYTVQLSYEITFSGTNVPTSLWTLQGSIGCGSNSLFFDLPNEGGTGTVTSAQTWTSATNCATATPTLLGCNDISIQINGPGINTQTITLTANPITTILTVTDNSGNSSTCTANVSVVDHITPQITCPGTQEIILNSSCGAIMPDYRELATIDDNCSTLNYSSIQQSPEPGTLINGASETTVDFVITDPAGNQNTCLFVVNTIDQIEPIITCPGTQLLDMDDNGNAVLPDYSTLATMNDECDGTNLVIEQIPAAGGLVSGVGTTEVSIIIHDQSGNIDQCTFEVSHHDVTPPSMTCSENQEIIANGDFAILPDYTVLASAVDNISLSENIQYSQSPAAGQSLSAGSLTPVTITATDEGGNTATCTFDVVVQEQTVVSYISSNTSIDETDGQINVTINIENPSPVDPVTVAVVLTSGDGARIDQFSSQTVTFAAGSSTSQVVSIPVTNNSICDLTNEIQISLMNIDGGYNAVAGTNAVLTIDINDDETIEPVVFTDDAESGLSSLWRMSASGVWGISSTQAINGSGSIRHISNGSSGTSWISRDLTHLPITGVTTEWKFNVNHFGHDPNQEDAFLIYLGATDADPSGSGVQGYALGVLPASSSDPDIIKLYRTLAGVPVQVIGSTGYDLNSTDQTIGWSVLRSDNGTWYVYMDANGGFDNLSLMCSGTDQTISRAEFFSVWYRNSTNTSGQLSVDDISVQQTACQCTYYTRAAGSASEVIWSTDPTGDPIATEMSQYKNVVVQSGHTLSIYGELITKDFQVNTGGSFQAGSSEIISYGNVALNGTFTPGTGMITFRGDVDHTLTSTAGSLTLNNMKVDVVDHNVILPSANETFLNGVAWIPTGTLVTNDKLTLISNATRTASIGTIGDDGQLEGKITMQRYIPNLTNYPYGAWLNLSCAVQGCTIQDWNDDIITTGFAGSDYPPPYSFNNISWYNEPTAGGFNAGYQYATNVSNALYTDRGYFVYMQTGSQLPVVKGNIYQHDFDKNLSFTNTGNASGDGWNLLSNQYPSEVDFRQMALNGVGVSSYSIYDAEISNYRTYNAVTNVGNASRYIASSQSFFVKAAGAGSYLKFREVFKSNQGVAFEREEDDVTTASFASFILKSFNGTSDEVVLCIHENASDAYDPAYDAAKLYSPVPEAVGCAMVATDTQELSIYCRQELDANINIPVYVNLPVAGVYSFHVNDLSNLNDVGCLYVADVYTGQSIPLSEGEVIQIEVSEPFAGNRLVIRSGSAISMLSTDVTCYGEANGLIMFNNISPTATVSVVNASGESIYQGDAVPYLDHLTPGSYHVIVSDEEANCPVAESDIVIAQPMQPSVVLQSVTPANCSDGVNGMLSIEVEHMNTFTYHLTSPEGVEVRSGTSDEDLLIFDDVPGELYTLTIDDQCGSHSLLADLNDPEAVKVTILSDDIFVTIVQGGSQYIYVEQESLNATDYYWSLSNGYESNSADFQYAFFEEGKYDLGLNASNEKCEDEDKISILVEKVATGEDGFVPVSMAVSQSFLMFTMNQNLSSDVAFTIHDTRGQLIWSMKTGMQQGKQIETGLSHLAAGVYFVNAVIEGKTILNRKIVKQ